MSSTPGTERTIDPGDTLHAEPLQVAGQLNLAGEAQIAPAELAGAGTAEVTGTGAIDIELRLAAAGIAEATGAGSVSLARTIDAAGNVSVPGSAMGSVTRPLSGGGTATATGSGAAPVRRRSIIAAGVSTTASALDVSVFRSILAAGVSTTAGTATGVTRTRALVAVGDSVHLGAAIASPALNLTGGGNTTTTGTATAATSLPVVASGTANTAISAIGSTARTLAGSGTSASEARSALPIRPTETLTIGPRSVREGEPVEIGGQLNIAGQLEMSADGAALDVERSVMSNGVAQATGTGVRSGLESNIIASGVANIDFLAEPTASRDILGGGVADATARSKLPITPGETLTIGPRSVRKGEPVEIGGQLNIAGQLEMSPDGAALDAAAEPTAPGELAATGSATAVDTKLLFAAAGVVDTTSAGVVSTTRPFAADGIVNAVGSASFTAGRGFSGSGTADVVGVGVIDIELLLDAVLSVSATGEAAPSTIVPAIRADKPSLGWQEDEDVTVGWQEDEDVTVGWQEDEDVTLHLDSLDE